MLPTSLRLGNRSKLALVEPPNTRWRASRSAGEGAKARRKELLVDVEDGMTPLGFNASKDGWLI